MPGTQEQPLRRRGLTVEAYYRLGETGALGEDARVELIEGAIIDMAPIGSAHAGTVNHLAFLLHQAVAQSAAVSVQAPLRLDRYSEPQPDLMLLEPRADFYRSARPGPAGVLLLVEVAESSLDYDRRVKLPLYARHGLPEVWLIDLAARALHVFREPAAEGYRRSAVAASLGDLSPARLPGVHLDLSALL